MIKLFTICCEFFNGQWNGTQKWLTYDPKFYKEATFEIIKFVLLFWSKVYYIFDNLFFYFLFVFILIFNCLSFLFTGFITILVLILYFLKIFIQFFFKR